MKSYSKERHDWEKEIQRRYALDIYKKVWIGCEIDELDLKAETNDFYKSFDFSGLDKRIKIGYNELHLAQRFRKPRFDRDTGEKLPVDFSLRFETPDIDGTPRKAEYFHLLNAYRNGYWYPDKYAFGVTKGENVDCGGFYNFYIFTLKPLLEKIDRKLIREKGPYPNRDYNGDLDGSSGIYFDLNDLQDCIFYELEPVEIATKFIDLKNTKQLELSSFRVYIQ